MLEDHRNRNRAVRPPKLANLAKAAQLQRRRANPASEPTEMDHNGLGDSENEQDSSDEADEADDDLPRKQRATRNSKVQPGSQPKATTIAHYASAPGWKLVLEASKQAWRRHIALVNAFPQRGPDLKFASLIVVNKIAEYEEQGFDLEQGLHIISINDLI